MEDIEELANLPHNIALIENKGYGNEYFFGKKWKYSRILY